MWKEDQTCREEGRGEGRELAVGEAGHGAMSVLVMGPQVAADSMGNASTVSILGTSHTPHLNIQQ